jgi:hypothetical protein
MDIRPALPSDLPGLHPIIERAYRGDTARQSWAIESAPPSSPRTSIAALEAILANPAERLLVALKADGTPSGCVQISDKGDGRAYLGLSAFGARQMEMTVISTHDKLIQYYQRRGYQPTGEQRPYPVPLDPPQQMLVLAKALAA